MTNEPPDQREQALHYAATLRGLSLVRTGNKYALAEYKLTDVTLDEIAAFLDVDGGPGVPPNPDGGDRRTNLRAMLRRRGGARASSATTA